MGLFSNLFGKKEQNLQQKFWALGYDLESFSKATGVSINTLSKYLEFDVEDIPTRTKNKIAKVINV